MLTKEIVMATSNILLLGFGMQEMLILLLIVLVLFGGSRLPGLAKGLGESIRNFKKGMIEESEETKETTKKV
jgi:sec-independent protein translocase protein TatA